LHPEYASLCRFARGLGGRCGVAFAQVRENFACTLAVLLQQCPQRGLLVTLLVAFLKPRGYGSRRNDKAQENPEAQFPKSIFHCSHPLDCERSLTGMRRQAALDAGSYKKLFGQIIVRHMCEEGESS